MSAKANVGMVDRFMRFGLSAILFYLALFFPTTANDVITSYTLIAAAVVNAIVALIGVCPVYLLIGVNTAKAE